MTIPLLLNEIVNENYKSNSLLRKKFYFAEFTKISIVDLQNGPLSFKFSNDDIKKEWQRCIAEELLRLKAEDNEIPKDIYNKFKNISPFDNKITLENIWDKKTAIAVIPLMDENAKNGCTPKPQIAHLWVIKNLDIDIESTQLDGLNEVLPETGYTVFAVSSDFNNFSGKSWQLGFKLAQMAIDKDNIEAKKTLIHKWLPTGTIINETSKIDRIGQVELGNKINIVQKLKRRFLFAYETWEKNKETLQDIICNIAMDSDMAFNLIANNDDYGKITNEIFKINNKESQIKKAEYKNIYNSTIGSSAFIKQSSEITICIKLSYELNKIKNCDNNLQHAFNFSEFAIFCIKEINKNTNEQQDKIDIVHLKAITQHLKNYNHYGDFAGDKDFVKKGEEISKKYSTDINFQYIIIDFYGAISTAYQNIFDFSTASNKLKMIVDYLSETKSPFGANLKGRDIGKVFGNYCQSLFFSIHYLNLFKKKEDEINNLFNVAMYYSKKSQDKFIKDDEKQIQEIYRTHGYLQQYIFFKKEEPLTNAIQLISTITKSNNNFACFAKTLLCKEALSANRNNRFICSLMLKLFWLENKVAFNSENCLSPENTKKFIEELPFSHPYEQIVGYLALLYKDTPEIKCCALKKLQSDKWGNNLVSLIAQVFCWQIYFAYDNNYKIILTKDNKELFDKYWYRYKGLLNKTITEINLKDNSMEPIMLLPFNYC